MGVVGDGLHSRVQLVLDDTSRLPPVGRPQGVGRGDLPLQSAVCAKPHMTFRIAPPDPLGSAAPLLAIKAGLDPRELRQHGLELGRQGRGELEALPRRRVEEGEDVGVEEEPGELPRRLLPPVERVARDRVAGRGEMDADLVGPAGRRLDLEQGRVLEDAEDAEEGLGVLAVARADRDPPAVARVPADRPGDAPLRSRDLAPDEAEVGLPDVLRPELPDEGLVGARRSGPRP